MGRNASWLTAATALARGQDGDAPHLIYFCERPVTVAEIAEDAIRLYSDNKKRGVISVSEGILGPDNAEFINSRAIWRELSQSPFEPVLLYLQACEAMMAATGTEKDDFGHPQLSGTGMLADAIAGIIKAALVHTAKVKDKVRLRADTLGYAQRAHAGEVSPVDAQEAEMVGRDAVTFAVQKNQDGTVVLLTARKPRYRAYTELRAISEVAGAVREFPPDFISAKGRDVTPEFVEYALPLAGPLLRSRQAK
jgi:6-phosphofructokinase 1